MDHIIEIGHLNKSFGTLHAVNDLSFHVREGELFAFLGVNGAGKSTTISILCGQLRRDSGDVRVCGRSIDHGVGEITRQLGVVFQSSVLDQVLTVRDNLESRAALYGITGEAFRSRLAELTEMLDMAELLNRTVGKLSGGNVQKVLVGREIAAAPTVLMAAYPVRGLDINSSYLIYNLLNQQKQRGVAVIFVGEDLDVLLELCDRILVIGSGRVTGIADGRTATKEQIGLLMTKTEGVRENGND